MKTDRILISGSEVLAITGTDDEVRAAAARMSQRTKACVTVAVVVGQYHRRGCLDRKAGGYMPEGN